MYCPSCGSAGLENAAFCVQCGTRLPGAGSSSGPPPIPGTPLHSAVPGTVWVEVVPKVYRNPFVRLRAFVADFLVVILMFAMLNFFLMGLAQDSAYAMRLFRNLVLPEFIVLFLGYFSLMEASPLQASLGKWAVKLRVVDANGDRLGFLRSLWRTAAKIVCILPLGMGFLRMLWDRNQQGLHDFLAGSLVVDKNAPTPITPYLDASVKRQAPGWLTGVTAALVIGAFVYWIVPNLDNLRDDDPPLYAKSVELKS